jgi:hypothetical protein
LIFIQLRKHLFFIFLIVGLALAGLTCLDPTSRRHTKGLVPRTYLDVARVEKPNVPVVILEKLSTHLQDLLKKEIYRNDKVTTGEK